MIKIYMHHKILFAFEISNSIFHMLPKEAGALPSPPQAKTSFKGF